MTPQAGTIAEMGPGLPLEEASKKWAEEKLARGKVSLFKEVSLDALHEGKFIFSKQGNVIVQEQGGSAKWAGLGKKQRPRFVRIISAILRGRPGFHGCSICGQCSRWMLLISNHLGSFELVLCEKCEGVWLTRHLQSYKALRRKGRKLGVGGYSGPLIKEAEANT